MRLEKTSFACLRSMLCMLRKAAKQFVIRHRKSGAQYVALRRRNGPMGQDPSQRLCLVLRMTGRGTLCSVKRCRGHHGAMQGSSVKRCRGQRETLQGAVPKHCKGAAQALQGGRENSDAVFRDISPMAMRYICCADAIYASRDACDMFAAQT